MARNGHPQAQIDVGGSQDSLQTDIKEQEIFSVLNILGINHCAQEDKTKPDQSVNSKINNSIVV